MSSVVEIPTVAAPCRIRGAAFREFLRWVGTEWGESSLHTACARLSEGDRRALRVQDPALGILASSWYPSTLVHALIDAVIAGWSAAEREEHARRAAHFVMDATLHGVYRMLFEWIATPERYAKYAQKVWSTYYASGNSRIEIVGGRMSVAKVSQWQGHHPFICELNLWAGLEIFTAMGCTEVETWRDACVHEGDQECRLIVRWG